MRDIPFYRLQKNKELSLRNDILKLQPWENIKQIIITIHEDSPEDAQVKCTIGNESKVITKEFAYFYGFDHLVSNNSNLPNDEKLDCTIQALIDDCAVSITINLW